MRLTSLELTDFRNISKAALNLDGDRHFFLGENGQGKTNILEAIAFAQGWKSFRTLKREALIQTGKPEAVVRDHWQHEKLHDTALGLSIAHSKIMTGPRAIVAGVLDGKKIASPQEILGVFPVVALSMADRELLYGGHVARRAEIDTLVSQIDPEYFSILAAYEKAKENRNALLDPEKHPAPSEFKSFESQMFTAARRIIKSRDRAIELLRDKFRAAFASYAPTGEVPDITYIPNANFDELPELWREMRTTNDARIGYTTRGPHRDHYEISLNGEVAELYASEGQKFSIVLAMKLAGLQLLYEKLAVAPVLVCDDLLLELDSVRQEKFWASIENLQVFASGTTPPKSKGWKIWEVREGKII
jgi:DNA replication and repair protein RecF